MRKFMVLLIFVSVACTCSFAGKSLFDKNTAKVLVKDFGEKKKLFNRSKVFGIFDEKLSADERDAMMFLYAYMSISDMMDYSGEYYLQNVQSTLKTRSKMSWGLKIPNEVFRHFVLPIRVNNEALDDSRMVFHDQLVNKVKDLSMYNAILEVNHWAHEKVIYTPSDARTSSPLASLKSAFGRCGEESTFLVAALRSVGIPARQVYTPRWAHTDDNHAWVEAWADGKWHFLGACEPEPILNLAWFNAPASRGLLMHTKVFGRYSGSEDVMSVTKNYTEINLIDNYAPSARLQVNVVDNNQNPVLDAKVEFKVYNYAEYYTVATKRTDIKGCTYLSAGLGDMMVFVSKGERFGFSKISFGKQSSVLIVLDKTKGDVFELSPDITPPKELVSIPEVSREQIVQNSCRIVAEDSVRTVYTSTFFSVDMAKSFAEQFGYSHDIYDLLIASRGNHTTLTDFLIFASSTGKRKMAVQLLKLISTKDLRDITLEVLLDNFNQASELPDYYPEMVLNPRVENEFLSPYKSYLSSQIDPVKAAEFKENPQALVNWCVREIKINQEYNAQGIIMSPIGVWKARICDSHSRDIFFVSFARSLGIPTWFDLVTRKIKYLDFSPENKMGKIVEVDFVSAQSSPAVLGGLKLSYQKRKWLDNPKYSTHFTISKYENGTFRLLNYDEEAINWENTFKNGTGLEAGYYMLTSGTRLANGGVLSELKFFNVKENDTLNVELKMREDIDKVQVLGSFNSENKFVLADGFVSRSILQVCGRGYFVAAVLGVGQEPTNHALKDIARLGKDFEKWGRQMVFLFPDEKELKMFNLNEFEGLPSTIHYGIDDDGIIQTEIIKNLKLNSKAGLPIFIIADTFNRVLFVSQGYTIGLGEQLLKTIHGL